MKNYKSKLFQVLLLFAFFFTGFMVNHILSLDRPFNQKKIVYHIPEEEGKDAHNREYYDPYDSHNVPMNEYVIIYMEVIGENTTITLVPLDYSNSNDVLIKVNVKSFSGGVYDTLKFTNTTWQRVVANRNEK